MATGISAESIADLIATTQRNLGRFHWEEIATELQRYIALPQILKKKKVKFDSGTHIQWDVMVETGGSARNVGMYEEDVVAASDGIKQAYIPWRHTTTNYTYERREVAMNRSPARIIDLVQTRRAQGMIDLAEKMEQNLWSKPASSADEITPYGIPYWIVKWPSGTTALGFNGGNPAGFTAGAANLSSSTYPTWANFTGKYTAMTKPDGVTKMREAFVKTDFMSPIDNPTLDRGRPDREMFVNYATMAAMETVGEDQNENLGRDIASMDGRITFRRCPVHYVPYLDADTSDPIYGFDWSTLFPVFLRGEYLNESKPAVKADQHTVIVVHVDSTWNFRCHNRRRNWVLSKTSATGTSS